MATTIAVIAAGAMGSAVSRRLVQGGCTVLTNLDGRSESTRRRALEAGMKEATYHSIAHEASIVLSILPPSDALSFAESFVKEANTVSSKVLFADCNAVNPETVQRISDIFLGTTMSFVDAGIIGSPPKDDYDPVFFASSDDAEQLHKFAQLSKYGLKIRVLEGDGAGVGAASALKMSYAGITKGMIGVLTTMFLGAHASSPATAKALLKILHETRPGVLKDAARSIPGMMPKAYRWVGEMEEIAGFLGQGEGDTYKGIAKVYERVETSLKGNNADIKVLKGMVEEAKKL
ncbi:6-phosphogluconate dehydrogenase C-terminal domain-like protein [Guyanagaster necrorhizus]|uniref:6-phosphogluconate dehydrogenase C-terminal domain-like protein n=1 Tax=Guyanagaster necrorhizus TaxID=856835 RepID=A0A9P7VXX8_9AGAR|nr:6-phosphogluconate dehydrogenase C-terminal domain-like protein [Guyanagaster necrorhizus MCA 3950]KAG7449596.1 6-phosphogluconate dehydrogenase C-terminal domain-like protein [Guyanagaster necrorhizus MCA 3950]